MRWRVKAVLPRNGWRGLHTSNSCRTVGAGGWCRGSGCNTVNMGAPAPSSMPPGVDDAEPHLVRFSTAGAMRDQWTTTRPLPAPVAPDEQVVAEQR